MTWLTETDPPYQNLESWETEALLYAMNDEDQKVALAVRESIPAIAAFVEALVARRKRGGRLFYVGSGTSGRLGVLDAAECQPTFGASPDEVIALIAGGPSALSGPVEAAEDNAEAAQMELKAHQLRAEDTVFAISASGRTPYALGAITYAKSQGALTGAFSANPNAPLLQIVDHPILVVTGPEFITGSTRLKAGTATKLVLNMISTAMYIRLGRVRGTRMIDLQLVNQKLWQRAIRYLCEEGRLSETEAENLLRATGSLRKALEEIEKQRQTKGFSP
jgi:N-acetylmuramic acid 6-phosphate etherase